MRQSAIRISESYLVAEEQRAVLGQARHRYGDSQLSPDEIGGHFDYSDWRGRSVSQQNFLGRWTILYFGYSRCNGSCRTVAPMIAQAADELRGKGYPAKAVFVDIETQRVGPARMISGDGVEHGEHSNWPMRFAMSRLYAEQGGKLEVMSGNRAQLARATAGFHVLREHVPPRLNEKAVSINHSSIVYVLGLDTFVAAYGYHDMTRNDLTSLVQQLAAAERKKIDYSAVRNRYISGACGNEAA
ncbi:hypothetical protein G7A66_04995 [Altererythrobacter sp. SALINAS58]|uniref:SCO family protein n=1 Tax=Alteripontixanthobacter muriae TaxID=2705546 RepID=UPI0015756C6D|nr:SCO family protein [Alteripontixanthobacter muriae]NTZ42452.1 hypothetical protein [Alteripontixanthobacter muriae]